MASTTDQPYWRVSPKFWTDTAAWTEDARTLGIYLLTCEHRTAEGLFVLRLAYIAADLEWPPPRVDEAMAELVSRSFVEHDPERSVVLIRKAMKYQSPGNPNMVTHALRKLALVPDDSPLTHSFKRLAERFCQRLAERLPEGFGEGFGEGFETAGQSVAQTVSQTVSQPFSKPFGKPPAPAPPPTPLATSPHKTHGPSSTTPVNNPDPPRGDLHRIRNYTPDTGTPNPELNRTGLAAARNATRKEAE